MAESRIFPSCGATTEPHGHDEAGDPLYEFYESQSMEKRILTESEVEAEIDRLKAAKPNRIHKWS